MNAPRINIIIATLNAGDVLNRCLLSVQKQGYDNFKLIIKDGLSTDNTLDIANKFADGGMPVKIISRKDSGIYDALNQALEKADGELIVILGADDCLPEAALQNVAYSFNQQDADIYVGKALVIHPDWQAVQKVDPLEMHSIFLNSPFCHNAMYARKHVYKTLGNFDTSYKLVADACWIHKAIAKKIKFAVIDKILVHFYLGGSSSEPVLVMDEAYRAVRQCFPELSLDDAKYLLHMAKGWSADDHLQEVLSHYPGNHTLHDAAKKAAAYAPFSSQRDIDNASKTIGVKKRMLKNIIKAFKRVFA